MRFDFSKVLLTQDDSNYTEFGKDVTYAQALKSGVLGLDAKTGQEKATNFDLYLKLKSATETTDFSLSEVALLDKAIEGLPTLFYGQLHYFLTNNN